MEKIFTVKKEYAKNLNRKERRKLAAKIRKDLAKEKNILKKDKAEPYDSADDGRKSVQQPTFQSQTKKIKFKVYVTPQTFYKYQDKDLLNHQRLELS